MEKPLVLWERGDAGGAGGQVGTSQGCGIGVPGAQNTSWGPSGMWLLGKQAHDAEAACGSAHDPAEVRSPEGWHQDPHPLVVPRGREVPREILWHLGQEVARPR